MDTVTNLRKFDRIASRETIREEIRSYGSDKFSNYLEDISEDSESPIWIESWNELDEDDEREALELDRIFGTLAEEMKEIIQQGAKLRMSKISNKYKRLEIKFPLTLNIVEEMINRFQDDKVTLDVESFRSLIALSKDIFQKSSILVDVELPEDGRIVVVGDIHGQWLDLMCILKTNGLPSEKLYYLFNGDIVDRGEHSCECLIIVLALKNLYPDFVFVNRGNHEMACLNIIYGFWEEFLDKYEEEMFEEVQSLFNFLPICTLIEKRVLVVHGGMTQFEDLTLDEIRNLKIDRNSQPELYTDWSEKRPWKVMEQLLWSDPLIEQHEVTSMSRSELIVQKDKNKPWNNSKRGAGIEFSSVVTEKFVENNGLDYIIRSHQMVSEGYQYLHNGKMLTIFSASNYCGKNMNKGAVIVIKKGYLSTPQFVSYSAGKFNTKETNSQRKESVLKQLKERIFKNRSNLATGFHKFSKDGVHVTVDEWSYVLLNVIPLNRINWKKIRPYFVDVVNGNMVNFHIFLNRFQILLSDKIFKKWNNFVVVKICEEMFKKFNEEAAFLEFDKDHKGKVSYQSFLETMKRFDVGLSENQIYDLMVSVDEDKDGFLNFEEFKKRFSSKKIKRKNNTSIIEIREKLLQKFDNLKDAYDNWSTKKKNKVKRGIEFIEMKSGLKDLGFSFQHFEVQEIFRLIDENNDDCIDQEEFLDCFGVEDEKTETWAKNILEKLVTVLHKSKTQLKRLFCIVDVQSTGTLDEKTFSAIMKAINKVLDYPMNVLQVEKLFKVFDFEGDGKIDYNEFVNALEIVDIEQLHFDKYKNVLYAYNEGGISSPRLKYFSNYINIKLEMTYQNVLFQNSPNLDVPIDDNDDYFVSFVKQNFISLKRKTDKMFTRKIHRIPQNDFSNSPIVLTKDVLPKIEEDFINILENEN